MSCYGSIFAFFLSAALPIMAFAQSLDHTATVEELADQFDKQVTYKSNQGCPPGMKCRGLGKRGISIVPGPGGNDQVAQGETGLPEYEPLPEPIQVNFRIAFDFDSAELRPDQVPMLASLCQAMHQSRAAAFQVVGHTDAVGSDIYNQTLSESRAQAVKAHLVSDCGIAETRLQTVGMGETVLLDPLAPRADVNRRVEFQALG